MWCREASDSLKAVTNTFTNFPFATINVQGAAEKSRPLNFFAVFSATVWDFNTKFYSFIY